MESSAMKVILSQANELSEQVVAYQREVADLRKERLVLQKYKQDKES